ncbi:hypothetical protein [Spongiactinospora sp. 9N601]|uniref:hypothetical protein n=1 Tax=Spongiactinospora sp. 9N601 TaxID=3375149 RepID=UPI00378D087C
MMPREELRAWVRRSCEAQGVPFLISDPVVLDKVASILREADRRARNMPTTPPKQEREARRRAA